MGNSIAVTDFEYSQRWIFETFSSNGLQLLKDKINAHCYTRRWAATFDGLTQVWRTHANKKWVSMHPQLMLWCSNRRSSSRFSSLELLELSLEVRRSSMHLIYQTCQIVNSSRWQCISLSSCFEVFGTLLMCSRLLLRNMFSYRYTEQIPQHWTRIGVGPIRTTHVGGHAATQCDIRCNQSIHQSI